MAAEPKYRPSLTASEMSHIIHLIDNSPYNPISARIKKVLKPMIFKAGEGITQPAFVSVPKKELDDSLGFSSSPSDDPNKSLWELHCKGIKLSEGQEMDALGYAFTNDLLTPEQEQEYTHKLMNSTN